MQILIKIAGSNVSSYMMTDSLQIESVITNRIDTARFTLRNPSPEPVEMNEVIISNIGETIRYFGGYIANIEPRVDGINKLFDCDCQDYTILLSKMLVNKSYVAQTDAYILNDIFTTYLAEVNATTYVATGLIHDKIIFNRLTIKECIDILSGQSGLDWYVDYSKNLHYFTQETNLAPFSISDNPNLSTSYPAANFKYKRDATDLINLVSVIGGTYLSSDKNFELPGNGQTTEVLLPYPMNPPDGQTQVLIYKNDGNDVTPSWTALGVGIDYVDELGGAIVVLHNKDQKLLKFTTAPPNLLRAIKITGQYPISILMNVRSQSSYNTYGRWLQGKIVNKDINSLAWAELEGKAVLAEKAFVKESGSFNVIEDGLIAGQQINIVNALRGINGNYLIQKVISRILGGIQLQYAVYFGEYNPDLIDMLIAIKAGAIQYQETRTDEILNELLEYTESLGLVEITDSHSDDFSGGLVYRWIAEPPLLQNGSFENGDPPTGWTVGGVGAIWERSAEQVKVGLYSGKLTRATNDCAVDNNIPTFSPYYQGKDMAFGTWVYATVAARAAIRLHDGIAWSGYSYHSGVAGWEWLTASLTFDATASILVARLDVLNGDTSAYFDGAIVVEGTTCSSAKLNQSVGYHIAHERMSFVETTDRTNNFNRFYSWQ